MEDSQKEIAEKAEKIVLSNQFQQLAEKGRGKLTPETHNKILIKLLSDAIFSYSVNKAYDKAPRPKEIISQIDDLRKIARKLKLRIKGLNSTTRGILAYRSKKDDRNVNEVLASIFDNTLWLEKKADRVLRKLFSGDNETINPFRYFTRHWKTGRKGGQGATIADNFLIEQLKNVYCDDSGVDRKKLSSPSAVKRKDGYGLGEFSEFVRFCFSELGEPKLTVHAIVKRIQKSSKVFPE